MRFAAIAIITLLLLVGCTVGRGSTVFPPEADVQAQPPLSHNDDGADHRLLIANGLSENITLIERTDGVWSVTADAIETGQSPNFMTVRDGTCYLVNSLSNSIQIIDPENLETVREISTGAGTNPMVLDFVGETIVMVSCYLSNEVLMIDISEGTPFNERILKRIAMPEGDELPHDTGKASYARPGGLDVVGDRCYVACANLSMVHVAGGPGVLAVIDASSGEITDRIELAGRDTISVLHSDRLPERLIILSAGNYEPGTGFAGDGKVESLDITSGEIFQVIEIDGAPFGGTVGPDDVLFLENGKTAEVVRVDLREGIQLDGWALPSYGEPVSYASAIIALPGFLAATNFNADRMYLLDPKDGSILAELATGDGPDAIAAVY